ncbi:hypothetical protein VTO42DRAFT_4619 [Malbranchea cinnamomea]
MGWEGEETHTGSSRGVRTSFESPTKLALKAASFPAVRSSSRPREHLDLVCRSLLLFFLATRTTNYCTETDVPKKLIIAPKQT